MGRSDLTDMLFIGPNDLSASLGNGSRNHMDCPDVQRAIEHIRVAAEKAGKLSGIFCVSAEQAAARFKQGFQLINVGGDIVAITSWSESLFTSNPMRWSGGREWRGVRGMYGITVHRLTCNQTLPTHIISSVRQ